MNTRCLRYTASGQAKALEASELLRKLQAAKFVAEHGEVCPAKWQPGKETLKPSIDLVGKL